MKALACDYHYLVTTDPQDVVKYSTRSDALAALHKLLAMQAVRGFTTRREPSGRYRSHHPDGRAVEFWIDDTNGDIVGSSSCDRVLQGLEIDCSASSTAHHSQKA
jgi:hypothetical protein